MRVVESWLWIGFESRSVFVRHSEQCVLESRWRGVSVGLVVGARASPLRSPLPVAEPARLGHRRDLFHLLVDTHEEDEGSGHLDPSLFSLPWAFT